MHHLQKIIALALALLLTHTLAQAQFVTVWQTNNDGISEVNQITIPAKGNYSIVWQEVGKPQNQGKATGKDVTTLTFPKAGKYKVSIRGGLKYIRFDGKGDGLKLLSIEQWGDITWTSMKAAFAGCENMTCVASDAPDLRRVKSLYGMFSKCEKFDGKVGHWNVSNIEDMSWMFFGAKSFNQPIGNWDVSKVKDMKDMFKYATSFKQDLSHWKLLKKE
jgi:surface protein